MRPPGLREVLPSEGAPLVCTLAMLWSESLLQAGDLGFRVLGPAVGAVLAIIVLGWWIRRATQRARAAEASTRTALESIRDAVVTTDLQGSILLLNQSAQQLTGWMLADALGKPFETVVRLLDEGTREEVGAPIGRSARVRPLESDPLVLLARDGTERPVAVSSRQVSAGDGKVLGAVVVIRDMAGYRQAEARSRHLAAIVDSSADAIISKDLRGVVTSWNAGAEQLFGYTAAEMIGRPIAILIPEDPDQEEASILERIRRDERVDHYETIRRRKDGTLVPISLTISPIHDAAGRVVGASKIARDITERRRLQAQVQDRIIELAEFNRRKDEFLATLAHELRNPLAPIGSAVHIMRLAADDPEMMENARRIIGRQHQQLTRLVDDLLDVARITRGRIEMQKQRTDLTTIVHNALESVKPFAESRGHDIQVSIADGSLWATVDPVRIAQVIANLLDNAVKFTPNPGLIRLSVTRQESEATVEVQDDGIGMSPSTLRTLFDSIGPGAAHDSGQRGLGIGLILVKAIVGMHAGTVEAHSAGTGRGSRIVVRLPLDVGPKPAAHAAPESDAASPMRRILVVDDNRDVVETLSTLLRLLGHEVAVAHDGARALELGREFLPQVALVDIGLPDVDGFEVARRFRADPKLARTVLVAVTGWGQEEDRRRSRSAGFDHHLTKPATMDDLLAVLQSEGSSTAGG